MPDTPPDQSLAHRYTAALAGEIETQWQARWDELGTYRQPGPGDPGFDPTRSKFYALDMFPYPSGAGLHVGHPEGYTATDIVSRYKRMTGHNVLHPMGWDAFGLPAEQHAINTGEHPAGFTRKTIATFKRQLKRFGFNYDWSREFATIDEGYYKWTQWIFLQIYKSWFDADRQRARPIAELEAEFESGERRPAFNPAAAEIPDADKVRDLGAWASLDTRARRRVIDSYRLAYVAEQTVNWCPTLGTALANEEVIDGRSERGGHPVFRKPLRQWNFRITAYAERLLAGLGPLDWPQSTKTQQTEWIGRSEGAEADFEIVDAPAGFTERTGSTRLRVYTTRPDTMFGATYMVVAPEHPLVEAALEVTENAAVRTYAQDARNRSDVERQEGKDKTGVPLGIDAINPATGECIPVWTADYVLMGYGTGAIMAVPGHDERDFEFAAAFGLPICRVVAPTAEDAKEPLTEAMPEHGVAVNSSRDDLSLDGMPTPDAKRAITAWLEAKGLGRGKVNYRLRDWGFSRQRYWGEPFPIAYDEAGDHHPIDESVLPLTLPPLTDYEPAESVDPQPLLAKATDWIRTTAGEAGVHGLDPAAPVTREANTMPGWAGSCWYHLRYCDPANDAELISEEAERYWLGNGVDLYIGGAEHAVLHLLYARFWHKVLHDLGHVSADEPYTRLFHQGLIQSHAFQRPDKSLVPIDKVENRGTDDAPRWVETEDGAPVNQIVAKMSKSLKNVVNPDDVIADYGADTFRIYEMYMGPLEQSKPWDTRAIGGMFRFLQSTWKLVVDERTGVIAAADSADETLEKRLHRTTRKVAGDIERLAFNTAIAAIIEFKNAATPKGGGSGTLTKHQIERLALILAPFAPHMTEELWHRLGRFDEVGSVHQQPWPAVDERLLVDDEVEVPVQVKGKVKARITVPAEADAARMQELALGDAAVRAAIGDATIRKVIAVPGRMVNIVTG